MKKELLNTDTRKKRVGMKIPVFVLKIFFAGCSWSPETSRGLV